METFSLTTIEILKMLGINKVLARDETCDELMTYPKGIGKLNVKYSKGIQLVYSGYAKMTPSARRFTVT